jgi:hypothetical protein
MDWPLLYSLLDKHVKFIACSHLINDEQLVVSAAAADVWD